MASLIFTSMSPVGLAAAAIGCCDWGAAPRIPLAPNPPRFDPAAGPLLLKAVRVRTTSWAWIPPPLP